jgi:hypothetical protein
MTDPKPIEPWIDLSWWSNGELQDKMDQMAPTDQICTLKNMNSALCFHLQTASKLLETGRNCEGFLDAIGRKPCNQVCPVEAHWPYGTETVYQGGLYGTCDLLDPETYHRDHSGAMSRDKLLEEIHRELWRAAYYLLILKVRDDKGEHFRGQMQEIVRTMEFLFTQGFSRSGDMAAKRRLEELSAEELRAVFLIVCDSYENLC